MTRRAYAIIIAGFFTVSIAYGIRYAYGMLLPEMLPALGISKTQAGTIFAIYFMVYTICTPVLGTLSDLFNYRLLVTLFTVVLSTGALLMAQADGFLKACLIFSVAGLGHAACWAPVTALVSKWVPDHKRGTALSFVTMGVGLGIPLWGILLPIIVSAADWRAGWLAMGFFGFGVAALDWVLVRNPEAPDRPKSSIKELARHIWSIYKSLFENQTFWIIGTAYLLIGFNVLVPFTFLPVYARESLNLTYATSTRFVAIIALFGIGGQLILGTLSDTMGRIKVLILCGFIMGIGCLGMIFFRSTWGLYACTAVYGLGYGAVWPVYAASASDHFAKSKTGSVVGLWTVFLGIGSIASPVICGWTIDKTGGYGWAFGLGLCSGVLSALVLVQLLFPKMKPAPEAP
jgi:MFS family permease